MKISKIIYFSFVVLISMLAGCKKETGEIEEDYGKPAGSISVNLPGSAAWNDVEVIVNASHTKGGTIAKVELYADGQWIAEDNQAPYEFSWDTRAFEDGEVELKARITDDLENHVETTTPVEVMNTLVDLKLPESYLSMSVNFKYFVFITGENRETLFFDQIESLPYEHTLMRPDGYNGETVSMNFVYANGIEGNLVTYHNLTAGSFTPVDNNLWGKATGNAKIHFTNIPSHDYYVIPSKGSGDLLTEDKDFTLSIYDNLTTGYVYLQNGPEHKYQVFKNLIVGDNEVSLANMKTDMDYYQFTLPEVLSSAVYGVRGHEGEEINSPYTLLVYRSEFSDLNDFKTDYHLPKSEFDHFSSFFNTSSGDKVFLFNKYHGLIASQQRLNMELMANSNKLEDIDMSVSGDEYDDLRTIWKLDANGYEFSWESFSENGNIEFPPIPAELTSAFPKFTSSSIIYKEAEITMHAQEYDHIQGYQEYLDRISGREGKSLEDGAEYRSEVLQAFKP